MAQARDPDVRPAGPRGRPDYPAAQAGETYLSDDQRLDRRDSDPHRQEPGRREKLGTGALLRPGRSGRHRRGVQKDPKGGADGFCLRLNLPEQVDRDPARQVQGAQRPGAAQPSALRRFDPHRRGDAPDARPHEDHRQHPPDPRGRGVRRGRGADAARHRRRRGGPSVRHAPQRARYSALYAHRAGAASQAAFGRRDGERLRDRAGLPQRGDRPDAQPRVHDDGALSGVRQLRDDDGDHREDYHRRARRAGDGLQNHLGGQTGRLHPAVRPQDVQRAVPGAYRGRSGRRGGGLRLRQDARHRGPR